MITWLRPTLHDPARGLDEIRFLGELARLAVVERDEIHALEKRQQIGPTALDPEVHRVARNELGLLDLIEHVELQSRIDVGQKDEGRRPELLGNLRAEVREHAQSGFQRLGGIEIVTVSTAPPERFALRLLESRQVHAALPQGGELVDGIVAADDADQLHRREVAG